MPLSLGCLGGLGCDLDSTSIQSGGIPLEPAPGETDASGATETAPTPVRGFSVVNSDYQSNSVSLLGLDGEVMSESFVASGSAPVGLSAPLDDVITPSAAVAGSELVLINRAPSAFLTWLDLESSEVRAQLNVDTGFTSNPQDYVQVAASKAYVTRHAANLTAGREPFDGGNDVLIVDPRAPAITGRIDLTSVLDGEDPTFLPRAARAVMAGGQLRVLSLGFDADFTDQADSRVVSIDPETDEITRVLVLAGMKNCGALSLSPDGSELAIGCSGPFGEDASSGFPGSGIVRLAVGAELEELDRFGAAELGGERVSSLTHASDDAVIFATYGRYAADGGLDAPDAVRALALSSGSVGAPVLESASQAFALGAVLCVPSASACLVADAETDGGVVHHFGIDDDGALVEDRTVAVDRTVGLPPRSLGLF